MPRTDFSRSATQSQRSHGIRRRFKGRMVSRDGKPRGHHIDKMRAPISYECGQPEAMATKFVPGKYKVQMPRNRTRYVRPA